MFSCASLGIAKSPVFTINVNVLSDKVKIPKDYYLDFFCGKIPHFPAAPAVALSLLSLTSYYNCMFS